MPPVHLASPAEKEEKQIEKLKLLIISQTNAVLQQERQFEKQRHYQYVMHIIYQKSMQ